jgi:predicted transcriptional regulator
MEILKTAMNGKVKTHIMYTARLSYAQLNEYLPRLVEKGFLENQTVKRKRHDKKILKTTRKGIKLLENFENLNSLWLPANDT